MRGARPVDVISPDSERWQRELQELDQDATVIVDLDHTLLLSSSTVEYLRSIRPRSLAVVVLAALSWLKVWRLAWWVPAGRREAFSDPLRVIVCTLLFPWTPLLWRRRGRILGAKHVNQRLIEGLTAARRGQVVVATFAARFIVEPILASLSIEVSHIVAGTFWRGDKIRLAGKAASVEAALGAERVAAACFITDSTDDHDSLAKVAVPILKLWPESIYRSASPRVYIPFGYTERIKRPGARHFLRQFLLNDLSLLILAIGLTQPGSIALYFALGLGLLSFFSIYELGYHENDVLGARNEANPKLSEAFDPAENYQLVPGAYIWALATGAVAVWLTAGNESTDLAVRGAIWVGFLASVRLTFALYNRVYKARILLYPVLQLHKTFGFLILGAASLSGLLVLTAEVASRSFMYTIYRLDDGRVPWRNSAFLRLVLYLAMAAAVEAANRNVNLFGDWRFWLIGGWLVARIPRQRSGKTRQAKP